MYLLKLITLVYTLDCNVSWSETFIDLLKVKRRNIQIQWENCISVIFLLRLSESNRILSSKNVNLLKVTRKHICIQGSNKIQQHIY